MNGSQMKDRFGVMPEAGHVMDRPVMIEVNGVLQPATMFFFDNFKKCWVVV